MTIYDIGDRPTVTGTFTSSAGTLTDPTTVTVRVREPDGTETLYTSPVASIVNSSTGVWAFTFPAALDAAGDWEHRSRSDPTSGRPCSSAVSANRCARSCRRGVA